MEPAIPKMGETFRNSLGRQNYVINCIILSFHSIMMGFDDEHHVAFRKSYRNKYMYGALPPRPKGSQQCKRPSLAFITLGMGGL